VDVVLLKATVIHPKYDRNPDCGYERGILTLHIYDCRWKKTKAGGRVLWHDADCIAGNSGSPIRINDERWTKRHKNLPGRTKTIIGVHTGQDVFEG